MPEHRLLKLDYLVKYVGEFSEENNLPFKYSDGHLKYTGPEDADIYGAAIDLFFELHAQKPGVAAQLPLLEDICPELEAQQNGQQVEIEQLVRQGILDEYNLKPTEKYYSLEGCVDIGVTAGIGISIPINIKKYFKKKLESLWISTKKPSKLKTIFAVATMIGAGAFGAMIAKDVHAAPDDIGNWFEKSPLPHPIERRNAAMASVYGDSKVVLFGGSNFDNSVRYNDTWAYDASTNNWEEKAPADAPSPRIGSAMAGVFGTNKVVLFGGWDGADKKDTWIYDTTNNVWTTATPVQSPPARDFAGIASIHGDDKVVLFGGAYGKVYPLTIRGDTWIYDLSDNNWTQGPSGPPARSGHSMAGVYNDDKAVLFGGVSKDNALLDDTWIFDLSDNQWVQKNPAQSPTPRTGHAMAGVFGYDKVVMFGGRNQITYTWIYDVSDNTWTEKTTTSFPSKREGHAMASIHGKSDVALFGGADYDGSLKNHDDTWIYDLTAAPPNPNEFVVITADTHIGTPNANKTLEDFVTQVNSMNPAPACVVVAGDVSDWGADKSPLPPGSDNEKQAKLILEKLKVPYYVVPGNHDARKWGAPYSSTPGDADGFAAYKSVMPLPSKADQYKLEFDKVVVFGMNSGADKLDSVVGDPLLPESTGLTNEQLVWFESALKSTSTDKQRVLVMHNPITTDKDGSISNNYAELLRLCQVYKVTVVAGHTHQLAHETVAGVDSWQIPSLAHQRAYEILSFKDNKAVLTHRVVRESTSIDSHSPVDINIVGSDGKTSGIDLEGKLKQDLPGTTLIVSDKSPKNENDRSEYLSVDGKQTKFIVRGLDDGKYDVRAAVNDDEKHQLDISAKTKKGQVDTYEIKDWDAVTKNKPNAVKVSRDTNGDGKPEVTFTSDKTITDDDFAKAGKHPGHESLQQSAGAVTGMAAAIGIGFALLRKRKPKQTKEPQDETTFTEVSDEEQN